MDLEILKAINEKFVATARSIGVLNKAVSEARGEAFGAQIVATKALHLLLQSSNDPRALFKIIAEDVEQSLENLTLHEGGSKEMDEILLESARRVCDETLSGLKRGV